jgi:nucleotide-binding universal stress UspA family protein
MSVVCALDRSENRRSVAAVGLRLAEAIGADTVFAHSVPNEPVFPYGDSSRTEVQRHASLSRARDDLDLLGLELGGGQPLSVNLRIDEPAHGVIACIREGGASLVVVGAGHHRRFWAPLARSVPRDLVAAGECPVVIVPRGTAPGSPTANLDGDAVVCGVNGSAACDDAAVVAAELAGALHNELVLVHAFRGPVDALMQPAALPLVPAATTWPPTDPPGALLRAVESVPAPHGSVSARFDQGTPAETIERAADEQAAALVVVGGGEHGLSGTTAKIVRTARVPVVVVPAGRSR